MDQRLFALVIGVNQYQSHKVSNLQGCVRDAETMRDMLLRYSKDAQILLLTDALATRAEILISFAQHLTDNPSVTRNDPIVVYFAGKGRRLLAQNALGRDVDMLLPHDCGDEISGISDSTLNDLLCDLAKKKGENITLILDTSFSIYVPRGNVGHRSETSPVPPSHIFPGGESDLTQFTGFFSDAGPSYVLLAACQKQQLAYESSDGGIFTQGLVSLMQQKQLETYRELSNALKFDRQDSVCSGLHANRLLFSIPPDSRISQLRVFLDSPFIDLGPKPENDFLRVLDKANANIALCSAPDGGIIIERLDGPVATYAGRHLMLAAEDAASINDVLNKIAHFNHYLCFQPPRPVSHPLNKFLPHLFHSIKPTMELYSFKYWASGGMRYSNKSRHLFRNGVARLDSVPADRGYAIRIISHSKQQLYPYLLSFDPTTYAIQTIHPSQGEPNLEPLTSRAGCFSSFTVGDGKSGGVPLTFPVNTVKTDPDAAFFKLIVCSKLIDISYMCQPSVLETVPNPNSTPRRIGFSPIVQIPGLWDTAMATVVIQPAGPRSESSWKKMARLIRIHGLLPSRM
ncbi:caspase domain-containing protein [Mycena epipterygia]|nr:caspase domain-containing protein [Mycena epipterygia]